VWLDRAIDFPSNKITDEMRTRMMKLYSDTYGKVEYGLYLDHQMEIAKIKLYSK